MRWLTSVTDSGAVSGATAGMVMPSLRARSASCQASVRCVLSPEVSQTAMADTHSIPDVPPSGEAAPTVEASVLASRVPAFGVLPAILVRL
jgi:hypothetical protein